MKYLTLSCVFLLVALKSVAQTPSNDPTWQLNWNDEFNYTGHPDPAVWKSSAPWGSDVHNKVFDPDNWHNVETNGSFLSLLSRRGSYSEVINGVTVRRPYTDGEISTKRTFQYGYFEAKIRMPDWDNPALYGGYHNNAFWFFNKGLAQNVDWSELDFEIIMNAGVFPAIVPAINSLQPNIHMGKPYAEQDTFVARTHDSTLYDDPDHFAALKIASPADYSCFYQRYYSTSLLFSGGWHIFGYEWLPDQIKFYVDNKLWFRLDGNFAYGYTDFLTGSPASMYPVHDLNVPMYLILGNGMAFNGGDTTASGPDSLSMDVDYVRYYTLNENCTQDDTVSGVPLGYEMVPVYNQVVYDSVALGKMGCGCGSLPPDLPCGVTITGGRETVRAKKILFEDGFRTVGNGELYAHDLDDCP